MSTYQGLRIRSDAGVEEGEIQVSARGVVIWSEPIGPIPPDIALQADLVTLNPADYARLNAELDALIPGSKTRH